MLVGYMRVSTDGDRQVFDLQRDALLAAGVDERLERTLFTIDWIEDLRTLPRHEPRAEQGQARNSLARAVFIHRLGEIRDRTYENQQHRASGLNLLVTAIILWNTRYLHRAIAALRASEEVPEELLAH